MSHFDVCAGKLASFRDLRITWPQLTAKLAVILLIWAIPAGPAAQAACTQPLAELDAGHSPVAVSAAERSALTVFYGQFHGACAWTNSNARLLINLLKKVEDDGLDPALFGIDGIERSAALPGGKAERHDLLLSLAALRYARVMTQGQISLKAIDTDVDFPAPKPDALTHLAIDLANALKKNRLADWLASLPPRGRAYQWLKEALAHYRAIAAKGGWQLLPGGPNLHQGDTSPAVPALRQRLTAEGYLAADTTAPADADFYDPALIEALKRFQASHGLNPDGILGPRTRAALNQPVSWRISQIIANLERRRILSGVTPPTRVEVNTAASSAILFENYQPKLIMRAVVGKPKSPTPMLKSAIFEVIINPTWTVPRSIIRKEIMPILRRDPGYLRRNNMHWVKGQLVQSPGDDNSLGHLKFNFANPFSVYLHDTPARGLFASEERARSHGCVRLEKPLELATLLLANNPAWPQGAIEAAIAQGQTIKVPLAEKMPVILAYWTVFETSDGTLQFRDDLYGRDARLLAALAALKNSPR